jgi:hypothetical protein
MDLLMRNRGKWIVLIIVIGLSLWWKGYQKSAIWVDDFSCMSDDVLSRIIVKGRYERPNETGFSMLDSVKIRKLSDSVFVGRDKESVINTFNTYGCGAVTVKGKDGFEHLICNYRRQWKIKNIGMRHEDEDVAFWVKPIVLVVYDFRLDHKGLVKSVSGLELIEMTRRSSFNEGSKIIN